jgi:hypothetical protein
MKAKVGVAPHATLSSIVRLLLALLVMESRAEGVPRSRPHKYVEQPTLPPLSTLGLMSSSTILRYRGANLEVGWRIWSLMADWDGGADEKMGGGGDDGSWHVYHLPIGTFSTTGLAFSVARKMFTRSRTFTTSILPFL